VLCVCIPCVKKKRRMRNCLYLLQKQIAVCCLKYSVRAGSGRHVILGACIRSEKNKDIGTKHRCVVAVLHRSVCTPDRNRTNSTNCFLHRN
jgi:hypothetical protein